MSMKNRTPIHFDRRLPTRRQAALGLAAASALAALGWWALGWSPDQAQPAPAPRQAAVPAVPATLAPRPPTWHESMREGAHAVAYDHEPIPETPSADRRHTTASTNAPADDPTDLLARNAGIDTQALSAQRPLAVQSFLREVLVEPDPRGGFVVRDVLPESRYARMGLQPGDRLYSLDTPATSRTDESSMVALMQMAEIELEIYRNGQQQMLRLALNADADPPIPHAQPDAQP